MIGEIRGDGQSSQNLTVHERFRPMEMTESARLHLMEMGAKGSSNNGKEMPMLIRRVIKI